VQPEFVLDALGSVWQGLEYLQPPGEVSHRFHIGRALAGALPGLQPIGKSLLSQTGLGVVMRYQLRLRLDGLGEAIREHLRNLAVILLPGALEERLIGRVLNEGMLEEIVGLWPQTPLIHQLRLHQLLQPML